MTRPRGKKSKELKREVFLQLAQNLALNAEFCAILRSQDGVQDDALHDIIRQEAMALGYSLSFSAANVSPLRAFKSQFGQLEFRPSLSSSVSLVRLYRLLQIHFNTPNNHIRHRHIAERTGFKMSSMDASFLSNFHTIRLSRLPVGFEYPPSNHFILECHHPGQSYPSAPRRQDRSCNYCDKFHILDPSQLSHTCVQDESAIFLDDDTGDIIAIVIRNLAKDYFSFIQKWAINLINDSIKHRSLSQRNTPGGQLARVGITEGSRSHRLFGWARNLVRKADFDEDDNEYAISSLFGLFYALLRAQVPWIAEEYEKVMGESQMPRLDKTNSRKFTLPLDDPSITFRNYPLAPPEGYIARDFVKQIHKDNHWTKCPWACYWNLIRHQEDDKIGAESGASFYISDYSLRILNASNTAVIWDISNWHGTGWYYNNVSHVGVTFLLSKATQIAWEEYQIKVRNGDIKDGDLLWCPNDDHESR